MLIGKTSALTMNIAGVIKDWMLIFLSYYLFRAPVTALNLLGYAFCCSGVSTRSLHACSPHGPTKNEALEKISHAPGSSQNAVALLRVPLSPHVFSRLRNATCCLTSKLCTGLWLWGCAPTPP